MTGSGSGVDTEKSVGGRSCAAGPSSDDGAAAPAPGAVTGAQEGAGNGGAFPFNSSRGSNAPACPAPGVCAPERLPPRTPGAVPALAPPEDPPPGRAPTRHRGRVPCRHITGALAGRRCTSGRRSVPALPHITGALGGGRRKPWLRLVSATLTDIPMPCALALGPLGTGKGGLQLTGRRHTQLAALQAGPHAPMAPAQPHRLDAPLRGGVAEAQFPHRVVEQAKTLAFQTVPRCVVNCSTINSLLVRTKRLTYSSHPAYSIQYGANDSDNHSRAS